MSSAQTSVLDAADVAPEAAAETRAIRLTRRYLLPFCLMLFLFNYLDRVNVSFAARDMSRDLGFTPAVYGLGAGIFFIGYFVFEIPSNLILHRVGARRWLSRIAVTWGLASCAMALVTDATSFYGIRLLLGACEAGLLPGLILYFSYWFPRREHARAVATLMTATTLAVVIGAPLSSALIGLDGWLGLRGWQIMFLLQGLPSVALGVMAWFYLEDRPETSKRLDLDERQALASRIAAEQRPLAGAGPHARWWSMLGDRRVLMITVMCFFLTTAIFGVVLWLPQLIGALGRPSAWQVALLSAFPFILATAGMIWWGARSDRKAERRWHLFIAAGAGAVGLAGSALAGDPVVSYLALCVATLGIWSTFGVFWATPVAMLGGTSAAAGFAFINSFGTLGGFVGPLVVGAIRGATGSFAYALLALAASLAMVGVIALALPKVRVTTL